MDPEPRTRANLRAAFPVDRALVLVAVAAVLALVLGVVVATVRDVPLADIVEDPTATAEVHPLTGVLSNLGILLWWTGAAVAVFAALVVRRVRGDGVPARFLLVGGLLTGYLAVDDLFLIHDETLDAPWLPQPLILGLMVLAFAWYAWTFRRFVLTTEWGLIVVAAVAFGGSLAVDFVSDLGKFLDTWETPDAVVYVEDSFKWLGIVAWTTYLVRLSTAAVVGAFGADPPGRRASQD